MQARETCGSEVDCPCNTQFRRSFTEPFIQFVYIRFVFRGSGFECRLKDWTLCSDAQTRQNSICVCVAETESTSGPTVPAPDDR
jgi:hypothetical protein